ncbi:MAG TPA: DUF2254 domain-containing protein [Longimicrobiales bacterium]|nr:DUF2254 domain-containing protein [Longimicrobiales bacterium]
MSRAALLKSWEDVRSSYWFIPTIMALGAILLSIVAVYVDSTIGSDWLGAVPWLYENRPAGARDLLSTIAGSMITVAGVTFSITIAAVAYAASQFGPRLLTNFMGDRGNQVTLGVFISTFLYCLLVLRTIRDPSEVSARVALDATVAAAETAFVPHTAILVGLALAVLSVGVLIYFIHHVPQSIHVSNVIAAVGRDLIEGIDGLFPEEVGEDARAAARSREPGRAGAGPDARPRDLSPDPAPPDAVAVRARATGYVQRLDVGGPAEIAEEHGLVVRLVLRPGDFARDGQPLAYAWPASRVTEEVVERLRGAFALGIKRTHAQDVVFLVHELAEIAARALSPGVNDPFTAAACIDWLSAAGAALAARVAPDWKRVDASGEVRVMARPLDFADFLGEGFGRIQPYVARDVNACLHQLEALAGMAAQLESAADRAEALRHARALAAESEGHLRGPTDAARVRERLRDLERLVSGRVTISTLSWERKWFLGRA